MATGRTGMQIANGAWLKANEQTDGAAVRWTSAEALIWINNGQREIVNQSPRANAVRVAQAFASGTRQNLLAMGLVDAVQLIDIPRNLDQAGNPGRPITKGDRAWLDDVRPDWHTQAPAAEAEAWMFDNMDPLTFWIYPQVATGCKGEIIYAAMPGELSDLTQATNLSAIYANALEAYLLFSFFSKDASYVRSAALAQAGWSLFQQCIGVRGQNAQSGDQASSQKAV